MNWRFRKVMKARAQEEGSASDDALNHLTPLAQRVLELARAEAGRFNHNFVGTEHLLLGMLRLGQGIGVTVLGRLGLDLEKVRMEVESQIGIGPDQKVSCVTRYTPRVKKVLALAVKEAKALNHTYVGTEHILLGLLQEGDGVAARVLVKLGVRADKTRKGILRELDPNFDPASRNVEFSEMPQNAARTEPEGDLVDTSKRYDVYCTEGNRQAVYRNALLKGRRRVFPKHDYDTVSDFLELEQAGGQTVFIAWSSVFKFCEHGLTAGVEPVPGEPE